MRIPHMKKPGSSWHTHRFPNSVYVLSGTLTLRDREDGKTLVVQGQAVGESVDVVHRGESGDEAQLGRDGGCSDFDSCERNKIGRAHV